METYCIEVGNRGCLTEDPMLAMRWMRWTPGEWCSRLESTHAIHYSSLDECANVPLAGSDHEMKSSGLYPVHREDADLSHDYFCRGVHVLLSMITPILNVCFHDDGSFVDAIVAMRT